MSSFQNLKTRLADIHNLHMASAVLGWDQHTYMPAQGAPARSKQLGTLAKLAHEMFVAPETLTLLAAAESEAAATPGDSDERAFVRIARRNLDKSTKVPTSLVVETTEVCSLADGIWAQARAENNYPAFAPWLDRILKLKRQYAAAIGIPAGGVTYDVLLDDYEEGMTVATLNPLFETLKQHLIPLVAKIVQHKDRVSDEPLTRDFDEPAQEQFSRTVLQELGYDFTRGRLDRAVHPFCTNFSQNDVRITTRFEKNWMPGALFGSLHEMGHAFYEMGVDPAYEATPLGGGVSLGIHESQSRLWENLVGRSLPFWERHFPMLQKAFPTPTRSLTLENFWRAINCVSPSFIRVEADEVTYNLHIILRFEMEQELLENRLSVNDAPAAWNDRMKKYLAITPPTDREGILQDVHWSGGGIGYFPTYTLGTVLASQLFAAARRALPSLDSDLRTGIYSPLREWLRTRLHQFGSKFPPQQLIQKATGKPLSPDDYLAYLQQKFTAIYAL